jgi:hypothetical protein
VRPHPRDSRTSATLPVRYNGSKIRAFRSRKNNIAMEKRIIKKDDRYRLVTLLEVSHLLYR